MPPSSSINFWLLAAATLVVDAVSAFWAYAVTLDRTEALYFGLVCGQISLICIWTTFSSARRILRWLAPFAFMLATVALTISLYERGKNWAREPAIALDMTMAYIGLWMAQILILLLVIWLLKQILIADHLNNRARIDRWQFSLMHLLAVMTVGALAIVVLREARIIHENWIIFGVWVVNNVILALLAVVIERSRSNPVFRLAALAAFAIVLGAILGDFFGLGQPNAMAINVIQIIVLFLWLEFGGIIPPRATMSEAAADSPEQP